MKQTLAMKLAQKFEKLNLKYVTGNAYPGSVAPSWLVTVLNFLEDYSHDSAITMKQLANNWHREFDSASQGNWADHMRKAYDEYKNMTSTVDA